MFSHEYFRWKCSRGDVGWLCWMIFARNLGSLGCGHLWDIKGIPQISEGAFVLAVVETSCVLVSSLDFCFFGFF